MMFGNDMENCLIEIRSGSQIISDEGQFYHKPLMILGNWNHLDIRVDDLVYKKMCDVLYYNKKQSSFFKVKEKFYNQQVKRSWHSPPQYRVHNCSCEFSILFSSSDQRWLLSNPFVLYVGHVTGMSKTEIRFGYFSAKRLS